MAQTMREIIRTLLRQGMRSTWLPLTTRLLVGAVVLIAVIDRVGTGPLLHGLRSLDGQSVGAALVLAAIATAAATWRWRLVATRLGVGLPWSTAFGMYYQSQFLNTVLPGGIVGDVHRAVAHGRSAESLRQTARSVAIERSAGQVVQLVLTILVLSAAGAEFEGDMLATVGIGIGVIVGALVVIPMVSVRARAVLLREARELRAGLGSVGASVQVTLASLIVVACHVVTFSIAATAVGERVPPLQMLTLALVVLLGASIPLNIGGWGPREGVAGWAFAVAGFGAPAGVAASTLFGALCIIAVAPGAIVTVVAAVRQRNVDDSMPVLVLRARSQEKTP